MAAMKGDAGLLSRDVRAGSRASFGTVEVDDVRSALGGHAHVVVDAGCPELELDRDLVVRCFPDFLDLQGQIVRAEPVGVARRAPLVDADG